MRASVVFFTAYVFARRLYGGWNNCTHGLQFVQLQWPANTEAFSRPTTLPVIRNSSHRHRTMAGGGSPSKVVQITNIAPQATKDQMQNLFGNIGKIDEIRLYPTIRDVSCPVYSRICYVKFLESSCVAVAQHMTNTVFIDRALIVCAVPSGYIPDEYTALEITKNGTTVPGLLTTDSNLPADVINRIDGVHPNQV